MRFAALALAFAAVAVSAPANADPVIRSSMPAIAASMSGDALVVRIERGVLGASQSLTPRTLTVVAKDASGAVVYEAQTPVSRRMTYARVPAAAALRSSSTVTVSIR